MGDDVLSVNPNTPSIPLVGGSKATAKVLDNKYFVDLVNTGRPLDLKSRTFGDTTYSIWSRKWFSDMEADYTGNYLYGYVGKGYLKSSDNYLKYGAGFAQVLSDKDVEKWFGNITSGHYGDNKQDAAFIQDGIDAYKENER